MNDWVRIINYYYCCCFGRVYLKLRVFVQKSCSRELQANQDLQIRYLLSFVTEYLSTCAMLAQTHAPSKKIFLNWNCICYTIVFIEYINLFNALESIDENFIALENGVFFLLFLNCTLLFQSKQRFSFCRIFRALKLLLYIVVARLTINDSCCIVRFYWWRCFFFNSTQVLHNCTLMRTGSSFSDFLYACVRERSCEVHFNIILYIHTDIRKQFFKRYVKTIFA